MTIHEQLEKLTPDQLTELCGQVHQLKERRDRLDAVLPGSPLSDEYSEVALNCAESRIEGGDVQQIVARLAAQFDAMESLAGVR